MYRQYISDEEYERIANDTSHPETFPHCSTTTFHRKGLCPYCDSYYLTHPDFTPVSYAAPEANGWGGNMSPIRDNEKAAEEEAAWQAMLEVLEATMTGLNSD